MSISEKRALFLLLVLLVILVLSVLNFIYAFVYERDVYFGLVNSTMSGYNVPFKTAIPMKYTTDCEDWCNQEPSCQAYEVTNASFC